ncbi:MAG: hypothetical protein LBD06_08380 [Candidatus Accumulibacter sp.]|nr:hypothetical protein [Accumulibacter sp.]
MRRQRLRMDRVAPPGRAGLQTGDGIAVNRPHGGKARPLAAFARDVDGGSPESAFPKGRESSGGNGAMTRIARRSSGGRSPARQRGQALTEVLLSMLLALIPVFVIGWALYAHGQARTTALNGARYAAWERTVWRDSGTEVAVRATGEIEKLMIERFFARPDAPIQSNAAANARAANADLPSFYSLHNGDKLIDIERTSGGARGGEAARPTLSLVESPEKTSTVATAYNGISSVMGKVGAGGMSLEDKGLYVAEVKVKLNAVRHLKVFEDMSLTLAQRAAVVSDGWSAGGANHEKAVARPMVPASALSGLTSFFRVLGSWTPFSEFRPGCVRGDVVPTEMLPSGTTQMKGHCQ